MAAHHVLRSTKPKKTGTEDGLARWLGAIEPEVPSALDETTRAQVYRLSRT